MIANVTHGSGFGGLLAYLLTGKDGQQRDRVAWLETRNLPTDDPKHLPVLLRSTAEKSIRVQKPVYHLTISLQADEQLSREQLRGVVDRTLRDLGLDEHQAVLVAHNDTPHQHVHVMINRVHPEAHRAWHTGHDYARIEKSLRQQERELGLAQVPGRHFVLEGQERYDGIELSDGDRRQAERTGRQPFGEHVREVARQDLLEARSWDDLHRRLAELGLRVEKRGRGLAITDGERRVKASYVDRKASLKHLEARLGRYQPPEPPREPDPGPSRRWREIRELRETATEMARQQQTEHAQITARVQEHTAQQERERHDRRIAAVSGVLHERLAEVYRDPASARRALDHAVRAEGLEKATRRLAQEPERFGELHGRGGLLANAKRWAAIEAAPHAAAAARDLQTVRAQARGGGRSQPATRALGGANRARRLVNHVQQTARRLVAAPRRDEAFLERNATNLVKSLGWTVAARVLNPAQYYLLRAAVTIVQKTVEAGLDRARG